MHINLNELQELLTSLEQTNITELTLKSENFELTVRRGSQVTGPALIETTMSPGLPVMPSVPVVSAPPAEVPVRSAESPVQSVSVPPPGVTDRLVDITSPMVGTFYRAPGPDEAPFVDVGDRIRVGQTVCIIEAMKLMNELEAEVAGEIVEILVQNGQPVEYGQTLMRVNPM